MCSGSISRKHSKIFKDWQIRNLENLSNLRYLETTVTGQNCICDERRADHIWGMLAAVLCALAESVFFIGAI
jgi:hypothetical protein